MIHIWLYKFVKATHRSWFRVGLLGVLLVFLGLYLLPAIESNGGNDSFEGWFDRVYWFIITVSTVGYGDMSPQTIPGKLICIVVVLLGVGIAASLIGGALDLITKGRRKKMTGQCSYEKMVDHVIIMGYHERKTKEIITQMTSDASWNADNIILVARTIETNPFEDQDIKFVKGDLHSEDTLTRCAAAKAKKILIDAVDDGETILTAIAVNSIPYCTADVIVYVEDQDNAKHIIRLNNKIRVIQSMESSLMVQEVQDPGVVKIVREMLSSTDGNTLHKIKIPVSECHIGHWKFNTLHQFFKTDYEALLLAVETSEHMLLNPVGHEKVAPGMSVFVISKERPNINYNVWDEWCQAMEADDVPF